MKNWDEEDFKIPAISAPSDFFEAVKKRLIVTRIKAQKARQRLIIAASCLLFLGLINCGIVLSESPLFAKKSKEQNAAEILYNNYFKTSENPFDE